MRRCFIHIGTHKTGTSSIQHMLDRNRLELLRRGYYYPRTGCPDLPGQHNLAWEISGDRRFQKEQGTIEDLIQEVKNRSEDVILSSEDFECALYNGSRFSDFLSLLQSCGFVVTVVVYIRNQWDYLPRIYLSHLHFGLDLAFAEALDAALDGGQFTWREWIVNFDYCQMLDEIGKTENVDIVVRSYDRARLSICSDFLSIFDLSLRDLQLQGELFENVSWPLGEFLWLFLRNKMGRTPLEHEVEAVIGLVSSNARSISVSPAVREKLFQRFSDSNRRLFLQYGIPEPELKDIYRAEDGSDTPYVDQLFVESVGAGFPRAQFTDPTHHQI